MSCLVCFAKDISISSKRAMMIMALSPAGRFYTTARSGIITTKIETKFYVHSGFSYVPYSAIFVRCMWTIIHLKILTIHNWHLGFETWVLHTKVSNPGSRTWVRNPGLFPKLQNPDIKTQVLKPGFRNLG